MNAVLEQIAESSIIACPRDLDEYQHEGVIRKFRDEWDVDEIKPRTFFLK